MHHRHNPVLRPSPGRSTQLVVLCLSLVALAASAPAETLNTVPVQRFVQQLADASHVITDCANTVASCSGNALPNRERVQGAPDGDFVASWAWLRYELTSAKTAQPADRVGRMRRAQAHLSVLAAEVTRAQTVPPPEFAIARAAAQRALARPEFRADTGPSWIERQLARLQDALLRLFVGVGRFGATVPWLAPLIEWGCFGLAAIGLLWFVRRSLSRQALRISLAEGAALSRSGDRDPAEWTRLADERAAAQDWRDAVHCLYWASIALLEGRRAWRPNTTRTPREYVRLLKPGTEAHRALRDLTRLLERVWYGNLPGDEADYRAAKTLFHELDAARTERAGTPERPGPAMGRPETA